MNLLNDVRLHRIGFAVTASNPASRTASPQRAQNFPRIEVYTTTKAGACAIGFLYSTFLSEAHAPWRLSAVGHRPPV